MSHHIYNTRGLVLSARGTREADRVCLILTRDLGLVTATAQGIRKGSSKLGGILLDLALADVSLVRGKHAWRVTTAALSRNLLGDLPDKKRRAALLRVAILLQKLMRGEEKHEELFDDTVSDALLLLDPATDAETWEVYAVSRLLSHLGYLSKTDAPATLAAAQENKKRLIAVINHGIRESGL